MGLVALWQGGAPCRSQRGWFNDSQVSVERDPVFEILVLDRLRYGPSIEGDQELKPHPLASHLQELLPFDVGESCVVTEKKRHEIVCFEKRYVDLFGR